MVIPFSYLYGTSAAAILASLGGGGAPAAEHRYWRMSIDRNAGHSSFTGITEIELRETAGGADVSSEATVTTNTTLQSGVIGNITNDNTTDLAQWDGVGTGITITFDFGMGVAKDINELYIWPNKDGNTRTPGVFNWDYSDDGVNWTRKFRGLNNSYTVGVPVTFTMPVDSVSRYWVITDLESKDPSGFSMAEMALRSSKGGSDLVGSGTASANSTYSTEVASRAVDGNTATQWSSDGTSVFEWFKYDFGSGNDVNIEELVITARNDSYSSQTPSVFTLGYSDDNRTYATKFLFVSNATYEPGEVRIFNEDTVFDPDILVFRGLFEDDTDGTSWTFSDIGVGTDAPMDRSIVVLALAHGEQGSTGSPTLTATFNAESPVEISAIGGDSTSVYDCARSLTAWVLEDDEIDNLEVVITASESLTRCVIAVYTMTSVSATPISIKSTLASGKDVTDDLIVNAPEGSVSIGMVQRRSTSSGGRIGVASVVSKEDITPLHGYETLPSPYTNIVWENLLEDAETSGISFDNSYTSCYLSFSPSGSTPLLNMVNQFVAANVGTGSGGSGQSYITLPFTPVVGNWLVVMMATADATARDPNTDDNWTRLAYDDDSTDSQASPAIFYKQVEMGDTNVIQPQVGGQTGGRCVFELEVPGGNFTDRIEETVCVATDSGYDPAAIGDYGPVALLQCATARPWDSTVTFGGDWFWLETSQHSLRNRKVTGGWYLYEGGTLDPALTLSSDESAYMRLVLRLT